MTGTWPLGWATGDIELASEYKKGIGAISDTTLGGAAASVDITSIVGTYAHLLAVIYGRSDAALDVTPTFLRFNGDTVANYDYQFLRGAGAFATAVEAFAITSAQAGNMPASTADANLFGAQLVFIHNYANAAHNKAFISAGSMRSDPSSGDMFADLYAGFWRSNAAINRITFRPETGNFVAGTRVTLYGIGA